MEPVTIAASELRTHCHRLLDEVAANGRTLVITKRGRPIAKLTPIVSDRKPLMGRWEGEAKIKGDIVDFNSSGDWDTIREWDELNKLGEA
jgi:prevent-host-death family protein